MPREASPSRTDSETTTKSPRPGTPPDAHTQLLAVSPMRAASPSVIACYYCCPTWDIVQVFTWALQAWIWQEAETPRDEHPDGEGNKDAVRSEIGSPVYHARTHVGGVCAGPSVAEAGVGFWA